MYKFNRLEMQFLLILTSPKKISTVIADILQNLEFSMTNHVGNSWGAGV